MVVCTQTLPGLLEMPVSFTPQADRVKETLAPGKVSDFRTSEVCRRNLPWLNTLHNLQNRGWSFYLKTKGAASGKSPF